LGLSLIIGHIEAETALLQTTPVAIRGKIVDENDDPLPGVTIAVKGSPRGVLSDVDGSFSIDVPEGSVLDISYIGYQTFSVVAMESSEVYIKLRPQMNELEEVTVVGFGRQKKESVISSIQTVNVKDLHVPSSNLTTAFSGRIAGIISYQTSGEPGQDNAQFFIRGITTFGTGKVDPLILIDNVEVTTNDLSRLHPDDIQSFSILKDATATAMYGARGANGVILVSTKEGREGKVKVSVRLENSLSEPTMTIKMADPITYMRLYNEAVRTRNPLAEQPYSNYQIENTIAASNPYVFPAVDWMDMLTKKMTSNQRANLNISGGGTVARYYIAASFTQDNGILKVDRRNSFNNNIDLKKYLVRSNININLTPTTEAVIRLHGTFDDYNGPISGGSAMYKRMLQVSPVRFPAYYEPDKNYAHADHILFGGTNLGKYLNPYADMVKGYRQESNTVILAQFELKQNLNNLIEGLSLRALGNTVRNSSFSLIRSYSPYYYHVIKYDHGNNEYFLRELNSEGDFYGDEALSYNPGSDKSVTVSGSFYGEGAVNYLRKFGRHDVSGTIVAIIRNSITTNASTLAESLPKRNIGISGRFTYGYDERYYGEFNFGYNGSEKFDKGHRWGFFPSFGLGWNVSKELFWETAGLNRYINKLRLKGTYGLVGNDEIGDERFFYISLVDLNGGGSYPTGYNPRSPKTKNGVKIENYPNSMIGWEIAYKSNIGIEIGLLNGKVEILTDIYRERRVNILQPRADVPGSLGLWSTPQVNVGKANGKGVDISVDYNQAIGSKAWITGRGNFTWARSVFDFYEEADYTLAGMPWRSRKGWPISQKWGYVAERLFLDDEEVENSPRQDFGEHRAGDIKYIDQDGDGYINENDLAPIGYPTTPELNYGFGFSAGYANFDLSFFFQGSGRSSFWINSRAMSPFILDFIDNERSDGTGKETAIETGLAQFIADNHWSEANQNPYAEWPRLSAYHIANNEVDPDNGKYNTWFMRDGRFLRLKSVEFGYSISQKFAKQLKIDNLRIYANGTNLYLFSKFKLWDVEMGGNGLGYPLQRVINFGVSASF
jgi:TonB-linked SusC/RagA family outer membrane protein